jgi:3-methyladenine DNA glycosylase AlkC
MANDNPLLKDMYFTAEFAQRLATDLSAADVPFDEAGFLSCVQGEGFAELSLKQKMRHITGCLHAALTDDYAQTLPALLAVAPAYASFDGMVFSDYVACYGLDDWDRSLPALRELTRYISAEFAIRPFLDADPDRALPYLYQWAADPDPAVRRLASEGSRPRLPWGMALNGFKRDPAPILPILEQLKDDPSEVVRRSVANNLNDIAKDNPDIVLDIAESWYGESEEIDRVVKHACRTLLKRGDIRAMRLFGFGEPGNITVNDLSFTPDVLAIGEDLVVTYELVVKTAAPALLRLEYAVVFAKARGKTSRKVFHQREAEFAPGSHQIRKKHSFRDLSTRKHYPGQHLFEIIVNGIVKGRGSVELLAL